ncbi:MAG: hypothetical protein JO060_02190 [Candidatus Eremiobacteraeota bacterium]|nr:hypothetical protein [Candidatus Eremiobacteraeota bacterium]
MPPYAPTVPSAVPSAPGTPQAEPTPPQPIPSPTVAPQPFTVSANRLIYYSDIDLVTGEDAVRVSLDDGTTITGAYFAMNLKLNRFIVAGGVELSYPGGHLSGAAFTRFMDFSRAYFVPVTDQPDRWTFVGSDYAHPLRGRDMPGDTFYLPEVTHRHVFLYAKTARFVPKSSAFFQGVRLSQLGTFIPIPSFFLSYSRNPNFSQNSLAGAYIDDPFPFAGSTNSLETAHLRYDNINKLYASYEQHLVTDRSYLVASINPLTRPQRQYNLTASDLLGNNFQLLTFAQESAFQQWFQQPLSASGYLYGTATAALRNSYLQLHGDWYYQSLLAQPRPGVNGLLYYGDPTHPWLPDHPSDGQLTWSGFDHRLSRHLPLEFRLRSGYGVAHDPYAALAFLNNTFYDTLWFHYVGINAYTPSIKLGKTLVFNAVADKQRQWFSAPHHIDTTSTTFSLSRVFGPKAAVYAAYQLQNVGDFFGAQQLIAYPPGSAGAYNGAGQFVPVPFPDYAAFRGFSTQRGFVEGFSFTPNPYFQTSLTMRENHDWPAPIAPSSLYGLTGRPPLELDGDVRLRVNRTTSVDIGRSYYFGFGDLRWSPQFSIRVGP